MIAIVRPNSTDINKHIPIAIKQSIVVCDVQN